VIVCLCVWMIESAKALADVAAKGVFCNVSFLSTSNIFLYLNLCDIKREATQYSKKPYTNDMHATSRTGVVVSCKAVSRHTQDMHSTLAYSSNSSLCDWTKAGGSMPAFVSSSLEAGVNDQSQAPMALSANSSGTITLVATVSSTIVAVSSIVTIVAFGPFDVVFILLLSALCGG
jgi:hypothetical protein